MLAALHFNYNVRRQARTGSDGKAKLKVYYPKYKYGEATVREHKVPHNYGKPEEIEYMYVALYLVAYFYIQIM